MKGAKKKISPMSAKKVARLLGPRPPLPAPVKLASRA